MQIYCRQCGKVIDAENINLNTLLAKCSHCNALFSFADMYEGVQAKPKLESYPIPEGLETEAEGNVLWFRHRWRNLLSIIAFVFSIFWNAIVWLIFLPTFTYVGIWGSFSLYGTSLILPLFIIPFLLLGLFFLWYSLAQLVNTTVLKVDANELKLSHGPIPFPSHRNLSIPVNQIAQLYVRETMNLSRRNHRRIMLGYELKLITVQGQHFKLLELYAQPEYAVFMEEKIETFLGIKNQPIRGEFR